MMPSPITRSDRPLTNVERLAGWCEAARRHAMRADSPEFNASPRLLPHLFLSTDGNERCETSPTRGIGQE
jgi:hypothetical protein